MGQLCDARCRTAGITCEVASTCYHENSALLDEWYDRLTDSLAREYECVDCDHRYVMLADRAA